MRTHNLVTHSGWLAALLSCIPLAAAIGQWKYLGPDGGAIGAVAQHPSNPDVFYVASAADYYSKLCKSTDHGQTWTDLGSINAPTDAIHIDRSNPSVIYACGYSGMRKSTNGGTSWSYNTMPTNNYVEGMCIDPQNPSILHCAGYVYTTISSGAYFKSTNGGTDWRAVTPTTGEGYFYAAGVDAFNSQLVFVGGYTYDPSYAGRMFKSTDGGASFSECTGSVSGCVYHILCDPSVSGKLFVAADGGVYRSTDAGNTWSVNSGYIPSPRRLAKSSANPLVLYVATYQDGIYRSTDGGINWTSVSSGIGSVRTTGVIIESGNSSWLFATCNAGIYHSTNTGNSWTASNTGLKAASVSTLAFAPSLRSRVYAGVEPDGVFKTSNALSSGTATWVATGSFATCRNTMPGVAVSITNPDSVFVLEGGG